jgi:outer membrane protein OmpA-like peptidoglycan-associated protein
VEHRDKANFTSDFYSPVIRAGFQGDFRLSSTVNLNLIADGNLVGDKFNDYVSQFPYDLYAALSVGVTFHFGGKHKEAALTNNNDKLEPKKEDKTTEVKTIPGNLIPELKDSSAMNESNRNKAKTKAQLTNESENDQTDVPVIVPKHSKGQSTAKKQNSTSYKGIHKSTGRVPDFKVNIFYPFDETKIDEDKQREAIREVVDFMNQYPDARIIVRGYADKGTGSHQFNYTLSNNRAENVTSILVNTYKIDPERIMTRAVGGSYQPFKQENMNRLVIISSVTKNNK